jgi:hypothetical protein
MEGERPIASRFLPSERTSDQAVFSVETENVADQLYVALIAADFRQIVFCPDTG